MVVEEENTGTRGPKGANPTLISQNSLSLEKRLGITAPQFRQVQISIDLNDRSLDTNLDSSESVIVLM